MKKIVLALVAVGVVGSAMAQGSVRGPHELRQDHRELRQDRRELRQDLRNPEVSRAEIRQDKREIRQDKRELRHDRREHVKPGHRPVQGPVGQVGPQGR